MFYRSDKFEKLAGGHFWLSERPSKPGSRGWGAQYSTSTPTLPSPDSATVTRLRASWQTR